MTGHPQERHGRLPSLPPSCTRLGINGIGLVSFFAALYAVRAWPTLSDVQAALLALASLALPIALLDCLILKAPQRRSTGLDFTHPRPAHWQRAAVKVLGLYGMLGVIGLGYWVIPEYHQPFYWPFWELLCLTLPAVLIIAIPYMVWVDRHMDEPEDGYWDAGRALLGQWTGLNRQRLLPFARGWLVKGFFLPLMFTYLVLSLRYFRHAQPAEILSSIEGCYRFGVEFLFLTDLVFATVGYILTLRLLDAHIRSTDATLVGWVAALACYQPFWPFLSSTYLQFDNGFPWDPGLSIPPMIYIGWGAAILCCLGVYVAATVPFGIRFSNLTHRGILTNGPYRYTKHPAYVSKNLAWWLIFLFYFMRPSWASGRGYGKGSCWRP